jgi:hypothetical protein
MFIPLFFIFHSLFLFFLPKAVDSFLCFNSACLLANYFQGKNAFEELLLFIFIERAPLTFLRMRNKFKSGFSFIFMTFKVFIESILIFSKIIIYQKLNYLKLLKTLLNYFQINFQNV